MDLVDELYNPSKWAQGALVKRRDEEPVLHLEKLIGMNVQCLRIKLKELESSLSEINPKIK